MTSSLDATTPLVRRVNLGKVLALISAADAAVTGSDVIEATGLTRATVHAVCNELIRLGWVRELASRREVGTNSGRPSRWFEFNERAGLVLGVDIGAHSSTVAVADLRGTTLAVQRTPTSLADSAQHQADQAQRAIRAAVLKAGAKMDEVLAVGMGFAARIDRNGVIRSENDESQTSYTARRGAIANLVGAAVLVDNDANLAALGERWRGAGSGVDDLAVLLAGERFGVGVIEAGRLLHGARGGVGEMSFLDMVEGVGSADGIALVARTWGAAAVGGKPKTVLRDLAGGVPGAVTSEMVFAAAAQGDRVAEGILDRLATRLARIIATLGTLLNPELVVIAGAVSQATEVLLDPIAEQLPALTATPPRLAVSTLGEGVVSIGAVKLALDHVLDVALDLDLSSPAPVG